MGADGEQTMGRFRKPALALAVAARLMMPSHSAGAQDYIVNGHAASVVEARYLASAGAPAGEWWINGFGITRIGDGPVRAPVHRCWFVLDVQLCDEDAPVNKTLVAKNVRPSVRLSAREE
jgi:hypothetical protein